jgi:hypothetical protein
MTSYIGYHAESVANHSPLHQVFDKRRLTDYEARCYQQYLGRFRKCQAWCITVYWWYPNKNEN